MDTVAVLGAGKIGEALLSGLLAAGQDPSDLLFTERDDERAAQVERAHGLRRVDMTVAARQARVLVVAVKPTDVDPLLAELTELAGPRSLVVSLCAGLPTARFEAALAAGVPVVRVMPNTPMLVGTAMCAISPGRDAGAEHLSTVEELLATVGRVVRVPESQQDAVTALSGSGPAYFYYVVEAMIEAGVGLGLARPTATELATQTALGAARMLAESGQAPGALREAVTSPGGTTGRALRELDERGVRAALAAAVDAARDRSVELGCPPADGTPTGVARASSAPLSSSDSERADSAGGEACRRGTE